MKLLINIDVPDIDKGIKFYTRGLGLRVGRRLHKRYCELLGASSRIYLLQEKPGTAATAKSQVKRGYKRHWTPIHFDFTVSNIKKANARVIKAGAKPESKIRKEKYGYIATFSDPFGHGFCLIQFTGRGYGELT